MRKPAVVDGPNAGETRCLGWCGKKFWSSDKFIIRFCNKCRSKRNHLSENMSRLEMQKMNRNDHLTVEETHE
mgnify:CR=1 FL=1